MSCWRSTRSISSTTTRRPSATSSSPSASSPSRSASARSIAIPISARFGDNVSSTSRRTPWYQGTHLLDHLERIEVEEDRRDAPFRLPVQWVNRPHLDFRGFAGTIASGRIARGEPIVVAGSGRQSKVARIFAADREVDSAEAGDAVTLTLADEVDIARGDVLSHPASRPGGRRSVHRARHLDERGTDAAGALLSHEDRHAHDARPRSPSSSTVSTSTTSTSSRPRLWRSTRSASAIWRSACRSPSTPTPTTARPAPSS